MLNNFLLQVEEVPLLRQCVVKCPVNLPDNGCPGKSEVHQNLGYVGKFFLKEVWLKCGLGGLYNMHQMFG